MIIHQADKGKVKGLHKVTNSHRSCFKEGTEYANTFTSRQQDIIDCKPVSNLRRKEIIEVINKARALGHNDIADSVYYLYDNILRDDPIMPSDEEVAEARAYLADIKKNLLK